MLGRGALNVPNLSRVVKYNEPRMALATGGATVAKIRSFGKTGRYRPDTMWHVSNSGLGYLRKEYDEATVLFSNIRTLTHSKDVARGFAADEK